MVDIDFGQNVSQELNFEQILKQTFVIKNHSCFQLCSHFAVLNIYAIVYCSLLFCKIFYSIASKPFNISWIRTGSQPYLILYCIVLQQNSTNIKIKIIKSIPVLLDLASGSSKVAYKIGFNSICFYLNIRRKLSIIRCDK